MLAVLANLVAMIYFTLHLWPHNTLGWLIYSARHNLGKFHLLTISIELSIMTYGRTKMIVRWLYCALSIVPKKLDFAKGVEPITFLKNRKEHIWSIATNNVCRIHRHHILSWHQIDYSAHILMRLHSFCSFRYSAQST